MLNGIYHLIVIAVAVLAILTGYRKGFLRQLGALLAVAFGIVVARLVAADGMVYADDVVPGSISGFKRSFFVQTLTCGIVYLIVESLVEMITFPVGKMMKVFGSGVLDSIGGSVFRLFKYLMVVSILYNLIADFNPSGSLTRSSRQHDGNVVEGVMKIAPAILGFPDGEEVGHHQQLEDAKKIS